MTDGSPQPPRVAALVLAAGRSTRMGGRQKLIMEVDGAPLVCHTVLTALEAGLRPVVVVTGHEAGAVAAALKGLGVCFAHNPAFSRGMSTSIRRGIEALDADAGVAFAQGMEAVCILLGDMPGVSAQTLRTLVAALARGPRRHAYVPTYEGRRGNPVLWTRSSFPELLSLSGDEGARRLLSGHPESVLEVEVDDRGVVQDIDTWAALAAWE